MHFYDAYIEFNIGRYGDAQMLRLRANGYRNNRRKQAGTQIMYGRKRISPAEKPHKALPGSSLTSAVSESQGFH